MPVVWIPSQMRKLTGGRTQVEVAGTTVRQLIDSLEAAYPGIRAGLCEDDDLREDLAVVVDGVVARLGPLEPVGEQSEVHFLPALGGG